MKKAFVSFLIASLTLLACREKQNIIPAPTTQPDDSLQVEDTTLIEDSSYVIYGITDYTIKSVESKSIPLEVMLTGKVQDRITLSLSGLPANTTAEFEPRSGYTGFNTVLTFNTVFAKPGIYPVIIKGTSEKKLARVYKVNLSIESVPCDSILVYRTNHFRTRSVWNQYILYGNTHMDYDNPDEFYFANLLVGMDAGNPIVSFTSSTSRVRYYADCDSLKITIPSITVDGFNSKTQQTGTYIIEGSGQIYPSERKVIVNYSSTDVNGSVSRYEMHADITL